jgi:ABC-2 type transport system ATP-binding protein
MRADTAVLVKSLVKRYGNREVLRGLDLSLPRGSITGLLGRNGAGKTTTIRVLLGLAWRDSGEVSVLGQDPGVESQRVVIAGRTGYSAEVPNAPPWMTLEQALRECRGVFPRWQESLADDLIVRFALDRHRRLGALSKGQRGQAAFTLAMARRPELLILDEPTSGFDPIARREFLQLMLDLAVENETTVLLASHLLDEVERACDRLAIIRDGRIVKAGPIGELLAGGRSLEELFATAAGGAGTRPDATPSREVNA